MTYNLLDESWIPILYHNGAYTRVGIRKTLEDAAQIRQIAASNPMDRVAIFRFLLALLYWCEGNPKGETRASPSDELAIRGLSKLDENRECFNLLGTGVRFYQDPSSRRSRAATDLIQEIPTGHNFWHFRHSTDRTNGLCAACCALGLLRLPLFSVSGLPDLKAGINGTPPIYLVPVGKSLLETLRLNYTPKPSLGVPVWVNPSIRPTGKNVSILTGLTLLSRKVWLHQPSTPSDTCVGCGAHQPGLIRTCEFETAGDQKNELWDDPHVVYVSDSPRKASLARDLTAAGKFRMDRPWPDLLNQVLQSKKFACVERPVCLFVVGFASDKAKNIDVWERTVTIPPLSLLDGESEQVVIQWLLEGNKIARRVRKRDKFQECIATLSSVRPDVEHRVSQTLDELIAGDDQAWQRAAQQYRPMMEVVAGSLSPGVTTKAVKRRRYIAKVLPDMRPRAESSNKPKRKKGGDK